MRGDLRRQGMRGEGRDLVFCTCRKPDDHTLMVQCNYCDEWYGVVHSSFVGSTAGVCIFLPRRCGF